MIAMWEASLDAEAAYRAERVRQDLRPRATGRRADGDHARSRAGSGFHRAVASLRPVGRHPAVGVPATCA